MPIPRLPGLDPRIEVLGPHWEVNMGMQTALAEAQQVKVPNNPLCDPKYRLRCTIVGVDEGSDALRFIFGTFAGRPSVAVDFQLAEGGKLVLQKRCSACVVFRDRREWSFLEIDAVISPNKLLRSNCREITRQIVEAMADHAQMPPQDRKRLLGKLGVKSTQVWGLWGMLIGAVGLAVALDIVVALNAPAPDRVPAMIGATMGGLLMGALFGYAIGRFSGWIASFFD